MTLFQFNAFLITLLRIFCYPSRSESGVISFRRIVKLFTFDDRKLLLWLIRPEIQRIYYIAKEFRGFAVELK